MQGPTAEHVWTEMCVLQHSSPLLLLAFMNGPSFQANSQKSGPPSQHVLLPLPSCWISWFYLLSLKSVQTCHLVSVLTTPALIQVPFISCLHYWNCPSRSAGFPFFWSPIHSPYYKYHQLKIIFVAWFCPAPEWKPNLLTMAYNAFTLLTLLASLLATSLSHSTLNFCLFPILCVSHLQSWCLCCSVCPKHSCPSLCLDTSKYLQFCICVRTSRPQVWNGCCSLAHHKYLLLLKRLLLLLMTLRRGIRI